MTKWMIVIVGLAIAAIALPSVTSYVGAQVQTQVQSTVQSKVDQVTSDFTQFVFPTVVVGALVLALALLGGRGASSVLSSLGSLGGVAVAVVVLLFALAILPSIPPMMSARATVEVEAARRAQLDNDAQARVINERATAAAGQAYATATGVALMAQATQTEVAISANSTAAANVHQATATAQAQEYLVRATATAEPYNASIAATNATNDQARTWGGTGILFISAFALLAFALAGSGWISTRGKVIQRGESIIAHGQVVNPERSVVPVTGERNEEWLTTLYRAYRFFRTGKLPEPRQTNGNESLTSSEQLLEGMRISILPSVMQEVFQPNTERDRDERMTLVREQLPSLPAHTQIVEQKDGGSGNMILSLIREFHPEQLLPGESPGVIELPETGRPENWGEASKEPT